MESEDSLSSTPPADSPVEGNTSGEDRRNEDEANQEKEDNQDAENSGNKGGEEEPSQPKGGASVETSTGPEEGPPDESASAGKRSLVHFTILNYYVFEM
jgi:hypothetical protein